MHLFFPYVGSQILKLDSSDGDRFSLVGEELEFNNFLAGALGNDGCINGISNEKILKFDPQKSAHLFLGNDFNEYYEFSGCVLSDDSNIYSINDPVDDDRRRVNGWKEGKQISKGYWEVSNHDTYGKVRLRNTKWDECMYAADYNSSGGTNPVYTWRPGNPVNQGYWIFEDLKVSCSTMIKIYYLIILRCHFYCFPLLIMFLLFLLFNVLLFTNHDRSQGM